MSGLARMLQQRGATCTGSDTSESDLTRSLEDAGISVSYDQSSGELPEACDLVVASAAVKPDHPELLNAQRRGIESLSYAEALGRAQLGRTAVCVAGTHGKSTTTAMLAHILTITGLDPDVIVGANVPQLGGGWRTGAAMVPTGGLAGRPGLMICEACEFNRSFHQHRPTMALVNNIEEDHLDYYSNLDEIVASFRDFALLLPHAADGGRLLINHDGAHRRAVSSGLECAVATFGFNPAADYHIDFDPRTGRVRLSCGGDERCSWRVPMPGDHNALNSAAAVILACWSGVTPEQASRAIEGFSGLDRRSQRLGTRRIPDGEVVVYDDYGHHPTEIEKTLKAIRAAECPKRLICVFQPHQHSRTRFLLEQFASSFEVADVVVVPHIFFVRDSEVERQKVSATDLVDRLRSRGICAMHLYPFEAIVEQLEVICRDGDLVVVMGAGPVWTVARDFLHGDCTAREERG